MLEEKHFDMIKKIEKGYRGKNAKKNKTSNGI
jgi:hypothetical protein